MTVTTAKYLAELLHEGQTRADKVTPYIEHPKLVAELVEKFGGDDECIVLAWLHDIFEESADKVQAYFGFDREIDSVARFVMQMRACHKHSQEWDTSFMLKLAKLSDHWGSDTLFIKDSGKVAYLSKLLIGADTKVVLVKLCDMLANITESKGTRMSQETRYFKAIQCLKMAERKDLDERHEELIVKIEALYYIHKSKQK